MDGAGGVGHCMPVHVQWKHIFIRLASLGGGWKQRVRSKEEELNYYARENRQIQ